MVFIFRYRRNVKVYLVQLGDDAEHGKMIFAAWWPDIAERYVPRLGVVDPVLSEGPKHRN